LYIYNFLHFYFTVANTRSAFHTLTQFMLKKSSYQSLCNPTPPKGPYFPLNVLFFPTFQGASESGYCDLIRLEVHPTTKTFVYRMNAVFSWIRLNSNHGRAYATKIIYSSPSLSGEGMCLGRAYATKIIYSSPSLSGEGMCLRLRT